MFGLFDNDEQVGFIALEQSDNGTFYLEKLAVLPEHRHKGFGEALTDFIIEYVKNAGGKKISIGIIYENKTLLKWYKQFGFIETGTKNFPHLPFTVCFMERCI
jgi:ribosomal protein S18 acetylase RimI-like enzyme